MNVRGVQGPQKKKSQLREVCRQYANKLRSEGVPRDQMPDKARELLSCEVPPAITEAKGTAQPANLIGRQRKEFTESAIRTKLTRHAQNRSSEFPRALRHARNSEIVPAGACGKIESRARGDSLRWPAR